VDKTSGGTVTGTKTYYPAAGAMRIGSTLYYVLGDQLGSANVVTDSSGTNLGEPRYYPFGETRLDFPVTCVTELAGYNIGKYSRLCVLLKKVE
jgi:hypothetical protein